MTTFTDNYGNLTPEQVENLKTVALLIEEVAGLQPNYRNVQFVLDVLAGEVKGENK